MAKRLAALALIFLIMPALVFATYPVKAEDGGGFDYAGVFRLHILANSDSAYDQETKLLVRDAVLEAAEAGAKSASIEDMRSFIFANGRALLDAAETVLRARGADYTAQLVLGEFDFPRREYAGEVYPSGRYQALRIILGEGGGHNWWCVMFPPLCILEGEYGEIDIRKLRTNSYIAELIKSLDGGKLWNTLTAMLSR